MYNIKINIYKFRAIVFVVFGYLLLQILSDIPTRIVVESYLYILSFSMLGVFVAMFIYQQVKDKILSIISIFLSLLFIVISHYRYNGAIDTNYDNIFFCLLFMMIIEMIILVSSYFIKKEKIKVSDIKPILAYAKITHYSDLIEIRDIKDCNCIIDMYGGSEYLDFKEQCQYALENKVNTTSNYTLTKSYFKWNEMQQEKLDITVDIEVVQ